MKHGLHPEENPIHLLHRDVTEKIIGAAFQLRQHLGYGFLERVYQRAMEVELLRSGCAAETEKRIQVSYKGVIVGDYDTDLLVNAYLIVELKIAPQHDKRDEAQLLNQLKATGIKVGFLVTSAEPKSSTSGSSSDLCIIRANPWLKNEFVSGK